MKKIAGSEVTRKRITELMSEGFDASDLMRTGMRLMIEQALELSPVLSQTEGDNHDNHHKARRSVL